MYLFVPYFDRFLMQQELGGIRYVEEGNRRNVFEHVGSGVGVGGGQVRGYVYREAFLLEVDVIQCIIVVVLLFTASKSY